MIERRADVLRSALPNGVFRCADGYIQVTTQVTWYSRVFRVIGRPEWIDDERITSNLNDPERDRRRGGGRVPGLAASR